ncbi:MAG: MogA/MoaB family molybdenum cofactor biosynthesis protein [Acidothermus cellulolyticus]|nr:MogA/MoaB family molybdenum cofactor biosynthesis protein [Acidothermus cellulolyticus]
MPRALVITVSTRAAAGVYPDRSGPVLVELLRDGGWQVDGPDIVPDGEPLVSRLRAAVAAGYDVVLTTGGTGISPTDRTPQLTAGVLDYEIPGIAEALRLAGWQGGVPTALLSRGVAGVAGRTLIINLAGSPGAVRDGMRVIGPLLDHAVSQLHGEDHVSAEPELDAEEGR